jgi:hypothetical protein
MIDVVAVVTAIVALLLACPALRAQSRAGGRIPPDRRAALRMAWADVRQIERDHGLEPTPVPWYVAPYPREERWVGTTSAGPR